MAVLRLLALVLVVGCGERRVELLTSVSATDAGERVDGGVDGGSCVDLDLDVGVRFRSVALAIGPAGPVGFGLTGMGNVPAPLQTVTVGDGGVVLRTLATNVDPGSFNAVGGSSVEVAFHAPDPLFQTVDAEGVAVGSSLALLSASVVSNSPWGLRLSVEGRRRAVVYRTFAAEPAFTWWDGVDLHRTSLTTGAVGSVDGCLEGERLRLTMVADTALFIDSWLLELDGGVADQARRTLPVRAFDRAHVCPGGRLFYQQQSAPPQIVTVDVTGASAPLFDGALLQVTCETNTQVLSSEAGGVVTVRRHASSGLTTLATFPVPTLLDQAAAVDAVSVWLLSAPSAESARLQRRCLR